MDELRMLKPISLLIILVIINTALAAELDISLIEYNKETQKARIKISNIGSRILYNLTLSIDEEVKEYTVLLRPISQGGGSIVLSRFVEPGLHTITAKTSENVIVEKEILFPKTKEQVQEEIGEKEIEEIEEKKEVIIPTTEKISYKKQIIALIIFIAVITALTFVIKFLKKRKNV